MKETIEEIKKKFYKVIQEVEQLLVVVDFNMFKGR